LFILNFIHENRVAFFSVLTALFWYGTIFPVKPRSFLKFLCFPIGHRESLLNLQSNPEAILITFFYVRFIIWPITLTPFYNPVLYVAYVVVIWTTELFLFSDYLFRLKNNFLKIIVLICSLLLSTAIGFDTILYRNYQIVNNFDFFVSIYLFFISLITIIRISITGEIQSELITYFVFLGFAIYSFLQILSSIILRYDFLSNYNFNHTAFLVSIIFWLISVPWYRHLKSKLTL